VLTLQGNADLQQQLEAAQQQNEQLQQQLLEQQQQSSDQLQTVDEVTLPFGHAMLSWTLSAP